ncbi:MAG: undecaprenyl diphosphate synthase family protein [Actinomycetota bacterium]
MATGEISRPQGFSVAMSHVVVCGGSLDEWCETDAMSWSKRIDTVVDSVASMGARWITVCPYGGEVSNERREALVVRLVDSLFGTRRGDRVWHVSRRGVVVIVDTCADGRERLAHAAASIPAGVDVDEEALKLAVLAPALDDPDLVIIFGDPTTLPPSLVWELAYSELVFLNVPWSDFDAEHVELAVDDFERRERRFGGVDS